MIQPPSLPAALPAIPQATAETKAEMRATAEAFEAVFLAEMLKTAGVGRPLEGFGSGGSGEDTFASYFADIHARALVARGGLGLADRIETALAARNQEDRS
jgi:peptidoglycan hydrolase FlgJ